jgi:hypothetical protein
MLPWPSVEQVHEQLLFEPSHGCVAPAGEETVVTRAARAMAMTFFMIDSPMRLGIAGEAAGPTRAGEIFLRRRTARTRAASQAVRPMPGDLVDGTEAGPCPGCC